ncbi:MAG: ATP synthase F1 subunit delta [Chthonomonadaceae bacterium]|nr:ATP synthase F1 subunit delta [Chthonomonadaceae bacterium]
MTDARVARRYAKALFNAAKKAGIVSSVEDDLNLMTLVASNSPAFKRLVVNPAASKDFKLDIFNKAFSDRVTAMTMHFVRLLLDKGREDSLELVKQCYQELRREDQGVLKVHVTTTIELSEAERRKLIDKLTHASGKTIEADFSLDTTIMGGIRVAYGNFVLDGSVRGALDRLKDRLIYDVLKQN